MRLVVVEESAALPVSLVDAKANSRVDGIEFDDHITALIYAAVRLAEQTTGRSILARTLELHLQGWPTEIRLPRPPVTAVVSVKYDTDGGEQTLPTERYALLQDELQPSLAFRFEGAPPVLAAYGEIRVRITVGYGAAKLPRDLRQYILAHVGAMFENPEIVAAGPANHLQFLESLSDSEWMPRI